MLGWKERISESAGQIIPAAWAYYSNKYKTAPGHASPSPGAWIQQPITESPTMRRTPFASSGNS